MKIKCWNCGHEFEGTVSYDELGWHSYCSECESSFDVEVISICVYRDTIEDDFYAENNLSEILVTEDFAKQYFGECIVPNCEEDISFDTWYNDEYTADETENFYQYAKEHSAILNIEHWK